MLSALFVHLGLPGCRQLKEDSSKAQSLSGEIADLRSHVQSSSGEVSRLQRELAEARTAAEALKRENGELRSFSSTQEQRLALCLREGEQARAELASLEAILNVLHLREVCAGWRRSVRLAFVFVLCVRAFVRVCTRDRGCALVSVQCVCVLWCVYTFECV